jgi:hypothetical protein
MKNHRWIEVVRIVMVAVMILILWYRVEQLEKHQQESQKILIGEIKNLQHDSIMLKQENLILYLKAERMQNWYDSIFNQGSEDNERKIYKGGGGGVDHQRIVRGGMGF